MAKFFNVSPFSFDNVDFFEFLEQYDLMEKFKIQKQNENPNGLNLNNLLNEN